MPRSLIGCCLVLAAAAAASTRQQPISDARPLEKLRVGVVNNTLVPWLYIDAKTGNQTGLCSPRRPLPAAARRWPRPSPRPLARPPLVGIEVLREGICAKLKAE
jgi:ABC-type amino acid transport substrate-binding protein